MTERPEMVPPGGAVVAPGVYRMPGGVRVIVEEDGRVALACGVAGPLRDFAVSVGCSDPRWFEPSRPAPGAPFRVALDAAGAHLAQCRAERDGTHAPHDPEPPPAASLPGFDLEEMEARSRRIRYRDLRPRRKPL